MAVSLKFFPVSSSTTRAAPSPISVQSKPTPFCRCLLPFPSKSRPLLKISGKSNKNRFFPVKAIEESKESGEETETAAKEVEAEASASEGDEFITVKIKVVEVEAIEDVLSEIGAEIKKESVEEPEITVKVVEVEAEAIDDALSEIGAAEIKKAMKESKESVEEPEITVKAVEAIKDVLSKIGAKIKIKKAMKESKESVEELVEVEAESIEDVLSKIGAKIKIKKAMKESKESVEEPEITVKVVEVEAMDKEGDERNERQMGVVISLPVWRRR